jgi:hypothetical protein
MCRVGVGVKGYLVVLTRLYVPASAFRIWCSVLRFSKPVSLWGRADASDAQAISFAGMLLNSIMACERGSDQRFCALCALWLFES